MKVFSVLVLCLCTGSRVAQAAVQTAAVAAAAAPTPVEPAATPTNAGASAPAVADAEAKPVSNFPIPDRRNPHDENQQHRGYLVRHCDDCPRERRCNYVNYEKSYCYVLGDPRCHTPPHSGCKGKGPYSDRWYYSNTAGKCFRFLHKGGPDCGGRENNFRSHAACYGACARRPPHFNHYNGNDRGYNGNDRGYNGNDRGYNGNDRGNNGNDRGFRERGGRSSWESYHLG